MNIRIIILCIFSSLAFNATYTLRVFCKKISSLKHTRVLGAAKLSQTPFHRPFNTFRCVTPEQVQKAVDKVEKNELKKTPEGRKFSKFFNAFKRKHTVATMIDSKWVEKNDSSLSTKTITIDHKTLYNSLSKRCLLLETLLAQLKAEYRNMPKEAAIIRHINAHPYSLDSWDAPNTAEMDMAFRYKGLIHKTEIELKKAHDALELLQEHGTKAKIALV